MTEQELIASMQALTSGAQAVLQAIMAYGAQASGTVTFQIGGSTYTIKSLQQQITDNATQQAADRLAFLQNFAGIPSAQTVTRDTANRLTGTVTTFATGYQTVETLTRDPVTGRTTGMAIVCKDNLGATVATITKTIVRTNGLYSGVL
jgi:hypothetical protein